MLRLTVVLNIVFVVALISAAAVLWNLNNQFSQSKITLQVTGAKLHVAQEETADYKEWGQSLASSNEELVEKLQQSTVKNNELLGRNRDLGEDVRRLFQENSYVEELNSDLDQEIRDAREKNRQFESDNRDLDQELREADSANQELLATNQEQFQRLQVSTVENSELKTAKDQLNRENQELLATNQEQFQRLQVSTVENSELKTAKDQLNRENQELGEDLEDLKSENQSLNTELYETQANLQAVNQRYQVLEGQSGSVDRLEARIKTLRSEIAKLEEPRKPLLIQSNVSTFRCTGSMEPKITCLDSATFLENFLPEDITVGTVISFKPTAACMIDSESLAHRVLKVKVERGVHYYWPKGDNGEEPDNCWIPETNVRGYIIQLHKNTEPYNAGLRKVVNDAQAGMDKALAAYYEKREDYCGRGHVGTCYLPVHQVSEVTGLLGQYATSLNYYTCTVNSARSALYYSDKRPPLYFPCLKAVVFQAP